MRAPAPAATLALFLTLLPAPAPAQPEGVEGPVDRILAVVDDDPILASDVEQVIALGLVERRGGESDEALRRRVLDELIEERLRFHEIDRFGFGSVPVEEVDRQYQRIREEYGGAAPLEEALGEVGLDPQGLRQLLARQLMVLTYVEERLGPRVFVSIDDIRAYYDAELVPRLEERGEPVPPIQEVREQIRSVLKEQRLNEEIERWTAELRARADVVNYFDERHDELPGVVTEVG